MHRVFLALVVALFVIGVICVALIVGSVIAPANSGETLREENLGRGYHYIEFTNGVRCVTTDDLGGGLSCDFPPVSK